MFQFYNVSFIFVNQPLDVRGGFRIIRSQNKLKASVITTLKNESEHLDQFIQALLAQTRMVDELVICDGGSTDGTLKKLKAYSLKYPFIKVITKNGGISVGRNESIRKSRYRIIAVTDAGTIADKKWLEKIIAPFEKYPGTTVVGGLFKIRPESLFEKVSATQMLYDHDNINPETWLPSSRSIAFRKEVWKEVGGYPEYLPFAGEDTVFDLEIKKAGHRIHFEPKAVVYWRPRPNLKLFYKQYFNYAFGDGLARTHSGGYLKKALIYIGGLMLLLIYWPLAVILAFLYILKKGRRVLNLFPSLKTFLISIEVTVTSDLAEIFGFTTGVLSRGFKNEKYHGSDDRQ